VPGAGWQPVEGTYEIIDGIATQQFEVDSNQKGFSSEYKCGNIITPWGSS